MPPLNVNDPVAPEFSTKLVVVFKVWPAIIVNVLLTVYVVHVILFKFNVFAGANEFKAGEIIPLVVKL